MQITFKGKQETYKQRIKTYVAEKCTSKIKLF